MRRNTLMSPASVGHSGIWRQLFLLFAGVLMLGFFSPITASAATAGELSVRGATVTEDAGTASVSIMLAHRVNHRVSVGWRTVNGTAIAGSDYRARSGRVIFPKLSRTRHVTVPILDDSVVEGTEFFKVRLFDAVGARIIVRSARVTIMDNDQTPLPTMSVANATAQEGADLEFAVTLDKTATAAVTFHYGTSDGTATAPGDYTTESGTGTIAAGSDHTVVTVPTTEDSRHEATETMTLTVSDVAGADLVHGSATGTIVDDDVAPTMSIHNALPVSEGGYARFLVTLSAKSELPAKAEWATHNGTAIAPFDYASDSGVVTVPAGETSAWITVKTHHDALYEPGANEFFFVTLSAPHDAVLGLMHTAKADIIDADHVPDATLTGGTGSQATGVPFTVTLSPATTQAVSFTWDVHLLTGDTAEASDFVHLSGTVTVSAYHHSATFVVPTAADAGTEPAETFHVVLTSPFPAGSAVITGDTAQGTISAH